MPVPRVPPAIAAFVPRPQEEFRQNKEKLIEQETKKRMLEEMWQDRVSIAPEEQRESRERGPGGVSVHCTLTSRSDLPQLSSPPPAQGGRMDRCAARLPPSKDEAPEAAPGSGTRRPR